MVNTDLLIYLVDIESKMQTLIVGSDSQAKITLVASLASESPLNTAIDLQPQDFASWNTDDTDRIIYVDPSPDVKIIDQLCDAALPLILVTTEDFGVNSDLFVPFEAFNDSMSAVEAVHNIKEVIATSNSK
jgi:hypothetical protein